MAKVILLSVVLFGFVGCAHAKKIMVNCEALQKGYFACEEM